MTSRPSSDLRKHPAAVFAEAEDNPVQITRRDGEPLMLMSQREADARAVLLHHNRVPVRGPEARAVTDPGLGGQRRMVAYLEQSDFQA